MKNQGINIPKIVDSFLFSEDFEIELLLIKFILESPHVTEWIVLENAYSFQGEYKGLQARRIIESDKRFHQYLNRITIIEREEKNQRLEKGQILDEKAFKVEYWQRNLAYDYFLEKYDATDWIIISDVDEALDFTDDNRCKALFDKIKENAQGILHVSTKRYWFDFDNEYKIIYGIPMCTKAYLIKSNKQLHNVRIEYHADLKMPWNTIIGFEYSSCFSASHIIRKLDTGSHMGFTEENLEKALYCNHRVISEKGNLKLKPTDRFFLETIELSPENSPKYIRDNLATLKTNNINPDYLFNRKKAYPKFYSPFYVFTDLVLEKKKFMNKKFRFIMRRLHLEKFIYG